MIPLSTVFEALPRAVREIAREQGKEIDLEIENLDAGVDRSMLADVRDALIHLLRNAVDHGLESPSARQALGELRAHCPHLAVVGQSLGGVIATVLVGESDDVTALALLAPYFEMPPATRTLASMAAWFGGIFPYFFTTDHRSIHDPIASARSLSFGTATPRLLRELMILSDRARESLPAIKVPTLYIQAKHDNRIEQAVAERAFEAIGASEKRLVWLERGGHVVAADEQREDVARLVIEWLGGR